MGQRISTLLARRDTRTFAPRILTWPFASLMALAEDRKLVIVTALDNSKPRYGVWGAHDAVLSCLERAGRLFLPLHVGGFRWGRWFFHLLHVGYFVVQQK